MPTQAAAHVRLRLLLLAPKHVLSPQRPVSPSFLGAVAGLLVCLKEASGRTLFDGDCRLQSPCGGHCLTPRHGVALLSSHAIGNPTQATSSLAGTFPDGSEICQMNPAEVKGGDSFLLSK